MPTTSAKVVFKELTLKIETNKNKIHFNALSLVAYCEHKSVFALDIYGYLILGKKLWHWHPTYQCYLFHI